VLFVLAVTIFVLAMAKKLRLEPDDGRTV